MKKFLSLMIGITMSLCLFAGCGKKQEESKPYVVGTIVDGVYRSESLNLKYTPLANMKLANDEELATLKNNALRTYESQQANFLDVNIEFYAALLDEESVVEIVSYKLGNKDMSINDFVKEATSQQASEQFNVQPYKICDTEFSKVSDVKMSDTSYTLFCKKFNDYYVMILTTAENSEKIDKLLSGFSKL